jgi:hypothetical protein
MINITEEQDGYDLENTTGGSMNSTMMRSILAATAALIIAGCGGGGGEAPAGVLPANSVPTANAVPIANAGSAQSVVTGVTVTLDGSGSLDADRDSLTYAWTLTSKPAGSTATLSNSTSPQPTFNADVDGGYVASLIVNDGKVDSTPATVTVTAATANAAPVANAGSAQSVVTGATVTLGGSGSSDANNDPLTYAWTLTGKPAGSAATLAGSTSLTPSFVADLDGAYVVSLIVNDGKVDSAPATVTVTAATANAAPIANAGSAQSVVTGATVTLDGSGSSDANGDTLAYAWTLTSKPASSTATLSSSTSAKPTFNADLDGSYVASLIVNDGKVDSTPATVTITAKTAVVGFSSLPTPYPSTPFNEVAIGIQETNLPMPPGLTPNEPLTSLGDRITLAAGTTRTLSGISIVMSSWACETGSGASCVTTPGATFDQPITLRVYGDANNGSPVVATVTQTFKIPFRPSADAVACALPGDAGKYKDSTGTCVSGVTYKANFDLAGPVTLLGDTFAYDVSFNTSTHGATPTTAIGPADLLKIAVYQTGTIPSVGTDGDSGSLVWNGVSAPVTTVIPTSPAIGIMAQVLTTP